MAERDCSLGHHNVAGILTLRVLFAEHGEEEELDTLLQHWRGDRFLHLNCPQGWELVWVLRWDDPDSAREFARRYRPITDSLAATAPLSGPPSVWVQGRSVLVLTPGLAGERELLRDASEFRTYRSFTEWVADDCFPETPCLRPREPGSLSFLPTRP